MPLELERSGRPAGAPWEEQKKKKKRGTHLRLNLDPRLLPTPIPVAGGPNGSRDRAELDGAGVFTSSSV